MPVRPEADRLMRRHAVDPEQTSYARFVLRLPAPDCGTASWRVQGVDRWSPGLRLRERSTRRCRVAESCLAQRQGEGTRAAETSGTPAS